MNDMKQRLLCILLALVDMMSGAHAQEAYSVKLIEDGYYGDSKSVAITALRPGETVPEDIYQSIKENECELYPGTVVTLTIGVDEGWYVSKVMAITSITTEQMQAPRRTNESNLLTQVPVTKGEGGTWTFTMPEANVEIYIKYLNTPPYFINMDQTKLVVPENTVRAKAGTIKAIDDQGDAFTYEILGGTGEDLFEINLTTGVVSLRNGVEPFDFEEWKDAGGVGYTLVIGVCDTRAYNFDDVFGTQATFTVNISDKNEKPYFTNETDVIYIAEGATTSTDVVTYADIDKYATGDFVNNELTIISDESNLFEISADGHIKTKEGVVLDYETQKDQVFTIEVRVRDANKDTDGNYIYPDLYEDKTFKVKVSDVNEAPTFKAEAYNYELLATERTEQVLGTVETTDPDTYATNFSTITYSLEGDDAANFKIDATTGKISLTNGAAFNYADKSVYRFNAVANDTKNKVTVPVTVTLTRKQLTITADNKSKTFGATDPELTYQVEGLVGNDKLTVELSREKGEELGSYAIDAVITASSNYDVQFTKGAFTITACTNAIVVTITGNTLKAEFDGKTQTVSGYTVACNNELYDINKYVNFTGDSIVSGTDVKTYDMGLTESQFANTAAGFTNVTFKVTDGTLTITPKAVTITAQSHAFTYTGEAQSWAKYDVEGLVGDDAINAVVTGSITYPSQGTVANKVESYEFTKGTAGNYSVTTKNGELTMTAADVAITITAASQQWTYDGTSHSNSGVTITSGELLTGDVLVATAAGSVTNVADTETGNNPVAEGYKVMHGETDVTANYAITTVAGTLTITPKAVTITSQSEEFTYDGLAHTNANYDVEGLVGDDAIKAVVSESIKYVRENYVDNKIVSYEFTKGDPTNYDVKLKGGRLTMLKAKLILTGGITICKNVTNGDVTYSVDCSNVKLNGLVGSDKITISGVTVSNVTTNEEESEIITLNFSKVVLEGDNLDCYEFTTAEGAETVTITKTIVVDEEGTTTETTVTQETNEAGQLVTTTTENTVGTDGSTSNTEKKEWKGEDGNQHEKMSQQSFNADGDPLSSAWKQTVSDEVGPIHENGEYMWTDTKVGLFASFGVAGERNGRENWNENVSGNVWSQNGNLLYSFESETLYGPSRDLLSVEKTEQWDKQEEGLKATSELTGLINDEGNWDETLKRSVSDPLGNTLYTSVTNTTTDENDNTWMTSFEELYDPDKGEFIDILLASAKDEKDFPSLKCGADEDTEFKNLSGEFADIDIMAVPNEYAANPWVRTDESLLESLGLVDAYFQADNWSNIDVKCETEFNKEGDAIDWEYSYVVNQWTDETNMAVVNEKSGNLFNVEYDEEEPLYDFDAKFDSWNFDDESIFDKFDLHANGTWGDEDNRQIEIWGKEEDLRKISELYSPRRAPEEDENVPEGYIKIESGVDYEVLKEGPIILTIITKGGPMEIKSIKFKDSSISTTVREFADTSSKTADEWYTIDGRKLEEKPTKQGVYINGGKKVMIK